MVSSLAEQLAQGASLNSALLADRSRRKPAHSYLFSSKEAAQHDLDSIYALGLNGFSQLITLSPSLRAFEHPLFSDAAKANDRTLQTADANAQLDRDIASFLPLLGPFLMDAPTGKVIEWLVRRFRVNEFNVKDVLSLFFPYHESPHFTKMVTILQIPDNSPFRFLLPYKARVKSLPRAALVTEMLKNAELARIVAHLLPTMLKEGGLGLHRTLIAFHTSTLLDFIARQQIIDETAAAYLLPAAMEPVQIKPDGNTPLKPTQIQEITLASFLLLVALSQKCHLSPKALKAILSKIASCSDRVSAKQYIRTLVAVTAPQDELEKLPRIVVQTLLKMENSGTELQSTLGVVGSERLINPLIVRLSKHLTDQPSVALLNSILTCPTVMHSIIRHTAVLLLRRLVEGQGEGSTGTSLASARALLAQLQQRYPDQTQVVFKEALENEEEHDTVEQIVLSLSANIADTTVVNSELAAITASLYAEPTSRARAVRDLVESLTKQELSADDLESVKTALRARIHDTDTTVLDALYATPDTVVPVFLEDVSAFIASLETVLHPASSPPARTIIRTHLAFVVEHLYRGVPADAPALGTQIIAKIILPFLLYSKPREKTAEAAWALLEGKAQDGMDETAIGNHPLLAGCVEAVRWEQARAQQQESEGDHRNVELMAKVNLAVAGRIAENVLASSDYWQHLEMLLADVRGNNSYARCLSYLTVRALLPRLSGEQQVTTACQVLEAIDLEKMSEMGNVTNAVDDVQAFLHDLGLGTAVVLKPNSQQTKHRLQIAILTMLPTISRPPVPFDWLAPNCLEREGNDNRGPRYIQIMRTVYTFSNSSSAMLALTTHLLRLLFVRMGDDALSFLAGVWLSADSKNDHVCYAALRHAVAFLSAHNSTGHWVDFQTVIPALLVVLQNSTRRVREVAIECIVLIEQISQAKDVTSVYAFDAIYGTGSSSLKYVDWKDFRTYTSALAAVQSHLVHDGDYIQIFHQEHLAEAKGNSKKQAGYKQRVMCYLLSHVNACPLPHAKRALLKSLHTARSPVKHEILLPTIQAVFGVSLSAVRVQTSASHDIELPTLLASAFDTAAASDLNNASKPSWSAFEQVLRVSFKNDSLKSSREALEQQLLNGLFAKLSLERQTQLCQILLETGQNAEAVSPCKQVLAGVLTEAPLMMHLLVLLQPASEGSSERASKRARLDSAAESVIIDNIGSLSLLMEVLGSKSLPGSLELIACLLETLNKVVHSSAAAITDRSYVEQLLMSAVESAVANVQETSSLLPGKIRLDTLVELIRASDNPQTFHQALLVTASLARLSPDAVLHNVMPVFTFMGSNVFHRDDTYSFRVVQKTIDSIVPVMVDSLKSSHSERLDLYIASRDFLRIFTDASNHIPRHRRAKFFSHLVDVLGPDEFLPPVSMLLVDKMANRVVRQNAQDAHASLLLPLSAFQQYTTEQQILLLLEVLKEVHRLVNQDTVSDSRPPTFLDVSPDDEQNEHAPISSERRALALLIYCDHVLKQLSVISSPKDHKERAASSELLASLLPLATYQESDKSRQDVATAARNVMASTLRVMSATDFVDGVSSMVTSSDSNIQTGALELLGERLTDVAGDTRIAMTATVIHIVEVIRKLLSSELAPPLLRAAFGALASIARTTCAGEENSIGSTVPVVLQTIRQRAASAEAFRVLSLLCTKLGPRLIQYLRDIVRECVNAVKENVVTGSNHSEAVAALQTLLSQIPTFWSETELTQVVDLYLHCIVSQGFKPDPTGLNVVTKTMTKRVPSNVLLPTLCKLWASPVLQQDVEHAKYVGYFNLVKRATRAAPRPAVQEHLRALFAMFQDALGSVGTLGAEVEHELSAAFLELVVKLNETAFRPLLRRLCDWAFADDSAVGHAVTFCHLYTALLGFFKALMVPYMSFLWQPLVAQLADTSAGPREPELWLSVLRTLTPALQHDEAGFWREDRLQTLLLVLVRQVPVCARVHAPGGQAALVDTLVAAMDATDDDALLKQLNLGVLMHTRAEEARLRVLALECSAALWRAHGGKLLGFAAETTTFIAECAEDENDSVVRAAHQLKDAVESVAGNIDVL